MTLELRHEAIRLAFRDPFKIARAADSHGATTIVVELSMAGTDHIGLGEGFADSYYGETPATMAAVFPLLMSAVEGAVGDALGAHPQGAAGDGAIAGNSPADRAGLLAFLVGPPRPPSLQVDAAACVVLG